MKCIKKNKRIIRMSDKAAATLTENEGWSYCAKELWKKTVRDK